MTKKSVKSVKKPILMSDFPIVEIIQEKDNEVFVVEGNDSWFRLAKRCKGNKQQILFVDGATNFDKFKKDSLKFI